MYRVESNTPNQMIKENVRDVARTVSEDITRSLQENPKEVVKLLHDLRGGTSDVLKHGFPDLDIFGLNDKCNNGPKEKYGDCWRVRPFNGEHTLPCYDRTQRNGDPFSKIDRTLDKVESTAKRVIDDISSHFHKPEFPKVEQPQGEKKKGSVWGTIGKIGLGLLSFL